MLSQSLPDDGFVDFVPLLINFLLFSLGFHLIILFLSGIYRRRQKLPKGQNDNVLAGLNNIYILAMTGAVIAFLLSFFGIDIQKLFTGLSIGAAAIAIITKDYVANILSGIAISFSKEFAIGDYIIVQAHKGRVYDITLSKTALLTDEDDVIFIPNNFFYMYEFTNLTKMGRRTVTIDFEMNLEALQTVEGLEQELIQALVMFHDQIEKNSFQLRIMEVRKDSLLFKFQYVLRRADREVEREIRKKTVRRVVDHIRQEG